MRRADRHGRNWDEVALLRVRQQRDRISSSLFALPALLVLVGSGLSFGMAAIDRVIPNRALPGFAQIPSSAANTLLSVIAGATITTVGVVFSITVVSVQLASGQFSPRVIRNYFHDRRAQTVVGVLAATFAYCVVTLYTTSPRGGGAHVPAVSVAVAVGLALLSILTIVDYFNHSARALYVGDIVRRVADESLGLVRRMGERAARIEAHRADERAPDGPGHVLLAPYDGWVQQMSSDGILQAVPRGSTIRLETRVGAWVTADTALATIWPAPDDPDAVTHQLADAIVVGNERTMQQDLDFGLRQLVDIALRALSPAVNDPTTAIEVVLRVGAILRRLLATELPAPVRSYDDGTVLLRPHDLQHDDFVEHGFLQLRQVAAPHPYVAAAIARTLRMLELTALESGHPERAAEPRRQLDLLLLAVERSDVLDADAETIHAAARMSRPG